MRVRVWVFRGGRGERGARGGGTKALDQPRPQETCCSLSPVNTVSHLRRVASVRQRRGAERMCGVRRQGRRETKGAARALPATTVRQTHSRRGQHSAKSGGSGAPCGARAPSDSRGAHLPASLSRKSRRSHRPSKTHSCSPAPAPRRNHPGH
jgi:hypothetical protein